MKPTDEEAAEVDALLGDLCLERSAIVDLLRIQQVGRPKVGVVVRVLNKAGRRETHLVTVWKPSATAG